VTTDIVEIQTRTETTPDSKPTTVTNGTTSRRTINKRVINDEDEVTTKPTIARKKQPEVVLIDCKLDSSKCSNKATTLPIPAEIESIQSIQSKSDVGIETTPAIMSSSPTTLKRKKKSIEKKVQRSRKQQVGQNEGENENAIAKQKKQQRQNEEPQQPTLKKSRRAKTAILAAHSNLSSPYVDTSETIPIPIPALEKSPQSDMTFVPSSSMDNSSRMNEINCCFLPDESFINTNFQKAPELTFEEATEENIRRIMWEEGLPLVIRGMLSHWEGYKREDFSLDAFRNKFGETKLNGPRDVETYEDLNGWTAKEFIDHINVTTSTDK